MDNLDNWVSVGKVSFITGVICLLVWLIIWVIAQQLLSERTKCNAPLQLNIPTQNSIQ